MDNNKPSDKSIKARRKLLKTLIAGGGAATTVGATGLVIPKQWIKPVVDSVMLPAHAQTTGCLELVDSTTFTGIPANTTPTTVEFIGTTVPRSGNGFVGQEQFDIGPCPGGLGAGVQTIALSGNIDVDNNTIIGTWVLTVTCNGIIFFRQVFEFSGPRVSGDDNTGTYSTSGTVTIEVCPGFGG